MHHTHAPGVRIIQLTNIRRKDRDLWGPLHSLSHPNGWKLKLSNNYVFLCHLYCDREYFLSIYYVIMKLIVFLYLSYIKPKVNCNSLFIRTSSWHFITLICHFFLLIHLDLSIFPLTHFFAFKELLLSY